VAAVASLARLIQKTAESRRGDERRKTANRLLGRIFSAGARGLSLFGCLPRRVCLTIYAIGFGPIWHILAKSPRTSSTFMKVYFS